jgi:hypothetical protein
MAALLDGVGQHSEPCPVKSSFREMAVIISSPGESHDATVVPG